MKSVRTILAALALGLGLAERRPRRGYRRHPLRLAALRHALCGGARQGLLQAGRRRRLQHPDLQGRRHQRAQHDGGRHAVRRGRLSGGAQRAQGRLPDQDHQRRHRWAERLLGDPAGQKIDTPEDLKGKRFVYSRPKSVSESTIFAVLKSHGIKPSEVTMVAIGDFGAGLTALEHNKIDIAIIPEPIYSQKMKAGAKYKIIPVARRQAAALHPDRRHHDRRHDRQEGRQAARRDRGPPQGRRPASTPTRRRPPRASPRPTTCRPTSPPARWPAS